MKKFSTALAAMISCFALAACGTTDNAAPNTIEDTGAIAADVSTADTTNSADAGNGSTDIPCDTVADCPSSCFMCQMSIDKTGNAQKKCVVNKKAINAACNDNDLCTSGETCDNTGTCSGTPVSCDDKVACTSDLCDSKMGGCQHAPIEAPCDDGSACTTGDKCVSGKCAGVPVLCDDSKVCTDDSCDPTKGCLNVNNTATCDDGNICTEGDTCKGGACGAGTAKLCDDTNGCTSDSCVAGVGCTFTAVKDGSNCSDGDVSTTNDACQSGACVGKSFTNCETDADCAAKIQTKCGTPVCLNDTVLGPALKSCSIVDPTSYDDGNPCTTDGCSSTGGVFHKATTASCDDGNACTTGDSCQADKTCKGTPTNCDDGDQCTVDSCDLNSGKCINGDIMLTAQACDDKDPYTEDSCIPKVGCSYLEYWTSTNCVVPDTNKGGPITFKCKTAMFVYDPLTDDVFGGINFDISVASKSVCEALAAHPGSQLRFNTLLTNDIDAAQQPVGGLYSTVYDLLWQLAKKAPFVGTLTDTSFWNAADTYVPFDQLPTCVAAAKAKAKGP